MPLATTGELSRYDFRTDNVYFFLVDGLRRVRCAVSYDALLVLDPDVALGPRSWGRRVFDVNREYFERVASAKYDKHEGEPDGTVMVTRGDLSLIGA